MYIRRQWVNGGLVEFILFANNCIYPQMHVASNIAPDHVLYLRKHVQMCCTRVIRRKSQQKFNTKTNNHKRILHICIFDSHDCTSYPPVCNDIGMINLRVVYRILKILVWIHRRNIRKLHRDDWIFIRKYISTF